MVRLSPLLFVSLLGCGPKAAPPGAAPAYPSTAPTSLGAPRVGPPLPAVAQAQEAMYREAQAELRARLARPEASRGPARKLVFFLGDGMSAYTVTAARILEGQLEGGTGEEHALSFEAFESLAMVKTWAVDAQVPDSAATMSALMTGVKTDMGMVSVTADASYGRCDGPGAHLATTLLEQAESLGLGTGVVSTARLTHATPAATYAHAEGRNWESDADLPRDAEGGPVDCPDIASQLVDFAYGDGLEVALGGGWSRFLPAGEAPEARPAPKGVALKDWAGRRLDGRDLPAEWAARDGAAVVWDGAGLAAVDPTRTRHLLGLFAPSHLAYTVDRPEDSPEPTLAELTAAAIRQLEAASPGGWILVVEGARIDHGHHEGMAAKALYDVLAMEDAVDVALAATDHAETLVVVTADHGHAFTSVGYPGRGNPILGLVYPPESEEADMEGTVRTSEAGDAHASAMADGKPYTSLVYGNGPGAPRDGVPRPALTDALVAPLDYKQHAALPSGSESHSGEDVPLYATGPGAAVFGGVMEQHLVHHALIYAMGWGR